MKWILIFIISNYADGIHSNDIEFNSEEACKAAKKNIEYHFRSDRGFKRGFVLCAKKGEEPKSSQ